MWCDDISPAKDRSKLMHAKYGNTPCEAQVLVGTTFCTLLDNVKRCVLYSLVVAGNVSMFRLVHCSATLSGLVLLGCGFFRISRGVRKALL